METIPYLQMETVSRKRRMLLMMKKEQRTLHVKLFRKIQNLMVKKRRGNMSLQPVMMIPKRKSGSLKVTLFR